MTARVEPPVSDESVTFWDVTREQRFLLPWCTGCDTAIWYPRLDLSAVFGSAIEWREASGRATVHVCSITGSRAPAGRRTTGRTSSRWSTSPRSSH